MLDSALASTPARFVLGLVQALLTCELGLPG